MPLRGGIAVGARLAERLLQLLDDMRRRRQVGIAHAEIDDVGAGVARRRLGAVDLLEHVGRQAPDAVKFFHRPRLLRPATPIRSARRRDLYARVAAPAPALHHGVAARLPVTGCAVGRPPTPVARGGQVVLELLLLVVAQHRASRAAAACRGPPDRPAASPARCGVPSGRPPTAAGMCRRPTAAGEQPRQQRPPPRAARLRQSRAAASTSMPAVSIDFGRLAAVPRSVAMPTRPAPPNDAKSLPIQAIAREAIVR